MKYDQRHATAQTTQATQATQAAGLHRNGSMQLLKKPAVCAQLNISLRTLDNMIGEGRFAPGVRVGRYLYWTEEAVHRWHTEQFGAQAQWKSVSKHR
jgi:prophage regulatory protein